MREADLFPDFERIAPADAGGRGGPFADTVERQDHGFFERRREERDLPRG